MPPTTPPPAPPPDSPPPVPLDLDSLDPWFRTHCASIAAVGEKTWIGVLEAKLRGPDGDATWPSVVASIGRYPDPLVRLRLLDLAVGAEHIEKWGADAVRKGIVDPNDEVRRRAIDHLRGLGWSQLLPALKDARFRYPQDEPLWVALEEVLTRRTEPSA